MHGSARYADSRADVSASPRLWAPLENLHKNLFFPFEKVLKRLGNTDAFVHVVHVSDASLSRSDWQLHGPFYASHLKSMTCSKSLSWIVLTKHVSWLPSFDELVLPKPSQQRTNKQSTQTVKTLISRRFLPFK